MPRREPVDSLALWAFTFKSDDPPQAGLPLKGYSSNVAFGSWPCKNILPGEVNEMPGPVRSQATAAASAGWLAAGLLHIFQFATQASAMTAPFRAVTFAGTDGAASKRPNSERITTQCDIADGTRRQCNRQCVFARTRPIAGASRRITRSCDQGHMDRSTSGAL